MKDLSFNFETPSEKDKAVKQLVKLFAGQKAKVVDVKVDRKPSTRAGTKYRNVALTFDDSQRITIGFTESGDVFEARINGKMQPLTHQDDAEKTVEELARLLGTKRQAFQRAMLRVKLPTAPSARTSKQAQLLQKIEKRDALKEVIESKKEELAALTS